jgi:hypothetical protein
MISQVGRGRMFAVELALIAFKHHRRLSDFVYVGLVHFSTRTLFSKQDKEILTEFIKRSDPEKLRGNEVYKDLALRVGESPFRCIV